MPIPPAGIVTCLFTDIEASTKRWEMHPDLTLAAVARHDDLLRESIEPRHGSVFKRGWSGRRSWGRAWRFFASPTTSRD